MAHASICVRESEGKGRGLFATARIEPGEQLLRAVPCVAVPNDEQLSSRCCVCLGAAHEQCTRCKSAALCRRCAGSAARQVHTDECAALKRLAASPVGPGAGCRPADSRSLRLLIRLLLWRWRLLGGGSDGGGGLAAGSEWWGEGDALCEESLDDVLELAAPPPEQLSDALAQAFFHMAQQARFVLDAEARCGLDEAASLMSIVPRGLHAPLRGLACCA